MKVKCIIKKEKIVSKDKFAPHNPREYLSIGKIYNVYGILYRLNTLKYLVVGEYDRINENDSPSSWEPAELFEIVDNELPPNWYFSRFAEIFPEDKLIDPDSAIWGFKELATEALYNDRLMDRDADAIKVFFKRRPEIDQWEENRTNDL